MKTKEQKTLTTRQLFLAVIRIIRRYRRAAKDGAQTSVYADLEKAWRRAMRRK